MMMHGLANFKLNPHRILLVKRHHHYNLAHIMGY